MRIVRLVRIPNPFRPFSSGGIAIRSKDVARLEAMASAETLYVKATADVPDGPLPEGWTHLDETSTTPMEAEDVKPRAGEGAERPAGV